MRLRFEGFELDTELRTLVGGDGEVDVEPRVFDVVAYLAAHVERVVPKEELLDVLWGDRFVSEWALSTAVKHARRALGDNGTEQRILKTSHGRGYRIVVPVERLEEQPDTETPVDVPHHPRQLRPLPRPVSLVGRTDDLERLHELNEPRAAVTIVGPGGVGKTSLALTMAHDIAAEVRHDVWYVDLVAQTDHGVMTEVMSVVEGTAGSGGATIDEIAGRLGPGRVTLVLDNCEHLLDAVRTLGDELLDRCDDLSIVTTSRHVIGIAGERLVQLQGLRSDGPDSPGVRLFVRRGEELGAMADGDEDRSIASRIVERLGGLPLAIELAATRLVSASPAEVLDALDDQLAVLRGGPPAGRHSTMERTIDWSYQLLSPAEQRALTEISVFRSPFRLEAAEQVVDRDSMAELIHHLVQSSMLSPVQSSHGTRFRLLEPIRQFVEKHRDESTIAELRSRHAEYFAMRVKALARRLHTSDEPLAAAALTAEWPDVSEALRWGLAARRPDIVAEPLVDLGFHIRWQQRTEAYRWLEQALEQLDLEPALLKGALVVVALGAWTDGDRERMDSLHRRARDIGDTGVRGAMLDLFWEFQGPGPSQLVDRADAFHRAAAADDDPTWITVASAFRLTARAIADPDGDDTVEAAEALDRAARSSSWPSGHTWRLLAELMWAVRQNRTADALRIADEIAGDAVANGTPFFIQTAGPLLANLRTGDSDQRLVGASEAVRLVVDTMEEVNHPLAFRSAVIALHASGLLATAARVAGFAGTLDRLGHVTAVVTSEYSEVIDDLRLTLGADEFAHLSELGRRLTADTAADLVADAVSRPMVSPNTTD